ncbi:hypothetical protein FHX74_002252 [Friedmanniella endophytica]|uniref:Uncharacterized protein n=1 Tax=Microlunatus kandeliicorticis TaxID=1759536 RepID=A0A7W3ISU4_9ACTN|nr:hypothetical protein [Microlunatus kandeliicorticis]
MSSRYWSAPTPVGDKDPHPGAEVRGSAVVEH